MGIFSSDPHPIEKLVNAATDENLTSEDWSQIISVCDEVNSKPGKNGPIAVQALRSRLGSANGNVQLYSLTLLNALAQNCGPMVQKEIAATATTQALNKLSISPTTHRTVLVRLIDVLSSLAEQFSADKTLYQIEAVYKRVCASHPSLAQAASSNSASKSSASIGHKRNSPSSHEIRNSQKVDDDDEEDADLKRALELSRLDMNGPNNEITAAAKQSQEYPKKYVKAIYDFTASEKGELSFKTGDIVEVIDRVYKEWWKGSLNGKEGIFPANYVESYEIPEGVANESTHNGFVASGSYANATGPDSMVNRQPESSLNPEAMDEEYVFAQVPVVEKLLSILASASQSGDGGSVINNTDVQRLYHQISSMRPRLVQLIDEYVNKKEELIDLNSKLLQARRTYHKLMSDAASTQHRMDQTPPTQYSLSSPSVNTEVLASAQPNSSKQFIPLHMPFHPVQSPSAPTRTYSLQADETEQIQAQNSQAQQPTQSYHPQYFAQPQYSSQTYDGQFLQPQASGQLTQTLPVHPSSPASHNTQTQASYSDTRLPYPDDASLQYNIHQYRPDSYANGSASNITPSAPRTY